MGKLDKLRNIQEPGYVQLTLPGTGSEQQMPIPQTTTTQAPDAQALTQDSTALAPLTVPAPVLKSPGSAVLETAPSTPDPEVQPEPKAEPESVLSVMDETALEPRPIRSREYKTPRNPYEESSNKDEDGDEIPQLGNRISAVIAKSIRYAQRKYATDSGGSVLDTSILEMRKRGLSVLEIKQRLGGAITEQEVQRRLDSQLARISAISTSEYRALQISRLEGVINMCYDLAEKGSDKHIQNLLVAIERLNRIFELESDRSKIEVNLVSAEQASLLVGVLDGVLRAVLGDTRIQKALKRAAVPEDYVDAVTSKALDAGAGELSAAQETRLALDLDKNTVVL